MSERLNNKIVVVSGGLVNSYEALLRKVLKVVISD